MITAIDSSCLFAIAKPDADSEYRDMGGPRLHMIPDIMIAAHAVVQADQLAGSDRGYLRHYFPRLRVVQPA